MCVCVKWLIFFLVKECFIFCFVFKFDIKNEFSDELVAEHSIDCCYYYYNIDCNCNVVAADCDDDLDRHFVAAAADTADIEERIDCSRQRMDYAAAVAVAVAVGDDTDDAVANGFDDDDDDDAVAAAAAAADYWMDMCVVDAVDPDVGADSLVLAADVDGGDYDDRANA